LNDRRLSLSAIGLFALLITTVAAPEAFAREGGDVYTGPSGNFVTLTDPNACDTLVGVPAQCAVVDASNPLPPVVAAVIADQGQLILNPTDCHVLILSSGEALDADNFVDTAMAGGPSFGECVDAAGAAETNPDGNPTFDCATVTITPDEPAVVLAWSVEYPDFLDSTFSDWDRIKNGGEISVDIDDWVGDPSLVENAGFTSSFSNGIASVTEANLAPGIQVQLRVADSGDQVLDTGKIVLSDSCLQDPKGSLLCGNGQKDPGEECDNGDNNLPAAISANAVACSATCTIVTIPDPLPPVVGGELIPLDSTALLIAGMSANLGLIVPIVAGIAGAGAYFIKTRMNKE
jgi:hypothetical protein